MGFFKKIIKKSPVAKAISKDPIAKSTVAGKAVQNLTKSSGGSSKISNTVSSAFHADQARVAAPKKISSPTGGISSSAASPSIKAKAAANMKNPALSRLANTVISRHRSR